MKREFLKTGDGSLTIHLPEWNEQYHSRHGALAEALHVFINSGFHFVCKKNNKRPVEILEIGFGTGLNALLTYIHAIENSIEVEYTGIEAFPVTLDEVSQLNYHDLIGQPIETYMNFHQGEWEVPHRIDEHFVLHRRKTEIEGVDDKEQFDLVYFDAFGPRVQPELWTEDIFNAMYDSLRPGGVLLTYSAKGSVRRAMIASGFTVERLPGPPGKREMLRAVK